MTKLKQSQRGLKIKKQRSENNFTGYARNAEQHFDFFGNIKIRKDKLDIIKHLISGMSNWQNHQWMKAGYPRGIEQLEKFVALTRH